MAKDVGFIENPLEYTKAIYFYIQKKIEIKNAHFSFVTIGTYLFSLESKCHRISETHLIQNPN